MIPNYHFLSLAFRFLIISFSFIRIFFPFLIISMDLSERTVKSSHGMLRLKRGRVECVGKIIFIAFRYNNARKKSLERRVG